MRPWRGLVLLALGACALEPRSVDSGTPAALATLLGHSDPSRREEAAARLSIRGLSIPEALGALSPARAEEDTARLRAGIQEALAEPSPERLIRHAYHSLRLGCLARESKRVTGAFARQEFRLTEIYEPTAGTAFTRYLAQPAAYVDGAGGRYDLFCWIQAVRRQDSSWLVREIYVGLHLLVDAPFKTFASTERYPRGSALGRFFDLSELQKVAAVFPVLEELELTYGRIRDKAGESVPAGFHLNAGFAMEGKAGGRSVYFTAESGLDPREARGGILDREGFISSGTLGPWVLRGSGIWGAGGLKPVGDD